MGRLHMTLTLDLQGLLPGKVLDTWLKEHRYFICIDCQSLVADSHQTSHRGKCKHIVHSTAEPPANLSQSVGGLCGTPVLPTFEDICQLPSYTLHHIPANARLAFARVLSTALRNAVHGNTKEPCLKLFMLPKCVLHSQKRKGRRHKPIPIEHLCDFRLKGVAPNNNDTWELLQGKHPKGPLPTTPGITNPSAIIVPVDFNIMAILQSFPRYHRISSEVGVLQGDPLSSLFFCLVLHILITAIVGPKIAISQALYIIQELGPTLGMFINAAKCELYSLNVVTAIAADSICSQLSFHSWLASYLAIHQSSRKSAAVAEIYSRLNIALACSIASAILARELQSSSLLLGCALGNNRWVRGKPAALDITITSPLCPAILGESCHQTVAAVLAAETRKLPSNGPKCQELGWSCILLADETYGNWGKEAQDTISRLASHLAIHPSSPKYQWGLRFMGD
eukprot:Em0024g14a